VKRSSKILVTMVLAAASAAVSGAEPAGRTLPAERSGKEVVESRCAACHENGKDGAPRIGDRTAWIPRLREGLDITVRSAIAGHGAMPARGGVAEFSDKEIRNAVIYMFNPDPPAGRK
jgi:cytochrome c5